MSEVKIPNGWGNQNDVIPKIPREKLFGKKTVHTVTCARFLVSRIGDTLVLKIFFLRRNVNKIHYIPTKFTIHAKSRYLYFLGPEISRHENL